MGGPAPTRSASDHCLTQNSRCKFCAEMTLNIHSELCMSVCMYVCMYVSVCVRVTFNTHTYTHANYSGVTESLFGGGADLHLGGGARGRHRNEGCTIKSQLGGGNGGHGVNGGSCPSPPPRDPPPPPQ